MCYFFFRNDDVRAPIDENIIKLLGIFIKHEMPISLAVEPANITSIEAQYLNAIYDVNPQLIEIVQHGFHHNLKHVEQRYEFGKDRNYQDQYRDISKGKELMVSYFGDKWTPIFTFPFGSYNYQTLQAIKDLNYIGISTGTSFLNLKSVFKNEIGTLLRKNFIFKKKISYHKKKYNNLKIPEVSTSINLIKKYVSEDEAIHYLFEQLKQNINVTSKHTNVIGILLHHRFHKNEFNLIEKLLQYLQSNTKYRFCKIKDIIYES